MAKLSGIDTSNIAGISGIGTASAGREITTPGTYLFGDVAGSFVDGFKGVDTTIGPQMWIKTSTTSHAFTKVVGNFYWNFWGLKSDGTLWMLNTSTSFNTSYGTQTSWTQLGTDTDWEDLSGGRFHFGAIKNGAMYHLGYNSYGQAGAGNTTSVYTWTQVGTDTDWAEISKGEYFSIARKTDGTVYTAGRNYQYRTGRGTSSGNTTSWTQISNVSNAIKISAGVDGGAAITEATSGDGYGTPYVWGYNNGNNLGRSGSTTTPTAATVSGTGDISTMVDIAIGRYSSCCIDSSGYVYRAGYSSNNIQWDETGSKTSGFDRDGSYTGFQSVSATGGRSGYVMVYKRSNKHYPAGFIGISITEGEGYLEGSARTAIEDLSIFSGLTIDNIVHIQGYQSTSFLISLS